MAISDKEWGKFKEWQTKANRDFNTRPYRGRSQRDPSSVIGYHSKAIRPEHPQGERHHLVGLARMNPVFQTIKTKEQLGQFIDELRNNGVALGDSWEQMLELPRQLHDSPNPEAIHRVESELGLDNPLRYVPENATFDDALAAIPLIAEDQRASRRRVQDLQFRRNTIGDAIGGSYHGFSDNVLNPPIHENIEANKRHLQRQLSQGKSLVPRILEHPLINNVRSQVQQRIFGNRLTSSKPPSTPTTTPSNTHINKTRAAIMMGNRLMGAGTLGTETHPLGGSVIDTDPLFGQGLPIKIP